MYPVRSGLSGELAVRLFRETPESLFIETGESHRRALAARRPLLWVAVTHTVAAFATVVAMSRIHGSSEPQAQLLAACAVGVAAAFWAVWGWSSLAPLPAAVVGLVMYGSLTYAAWTTVHLPAPTPLPDDAPAALRTAVSIGRAVGILTGLMFVSLVFTLLGWAVVVAAQARRLERRVTRSNGLVPALSLYGLLLMIVASRHGGTVDDLLVVMRVMAFVVVAYAIVGWRSVVPAFANAGGSWLVVGAVLGLGTFAGASIYLDVTSAAFGLPQSSGGTDPWVDAGYGWAGAVAATALFPAVIEELAFRGVILPNLARLMTGGEAIFVSAALFAVLHLNPASVPFLLPMGVALGYLRRRSGSVWPCILMHLTHNLAVVAAERWM
jgi:membrane protease YdiL (CAAX protease family)